MCYTRYNLAGIKRFSGTISISSRMTQCRIILLLGLQPITKLHLFTIELKWRDDFRCFRIKCAFVCSTSTPVNIWRCLIYQIVGISVLNINITTFSVFGAVLSHNCYVGGHPHPADHDRSGTYTNFVDSRIILFYYFNFQLLIIILCYLNLIMLSIYLCKYSDA